MIRATAFLELLESRLDLERPGGGDYVGRTLEPGGGFEMDCKELVESESMSLSKCSIRDIATTFCKVTPMGAIVRPRTSYSSGPGASKDLLEAGSAINSTAWPTVISALVFAEIRQPFELEELVLSKRVRTIQSDVPGTETVPSATGFGDEAEEILESREYPRIVTSEATNTLPEKTKKGAIVEVTREMIRFDRTGLAVASARQIGRIGAWGKERRLADALVGALANYIRNGTAYATYLLTGQWINRLVGAPLTDWTSLDAARALQANLVDPDNGLPLMTGSRQQLIVMPSKEWTARQIVGATEVRSAGAAVGSVQVAPNPIRNVEVLASAFIRARAIASGQSAATVDDTSFIGDLAEFMAWVENWALTVEELEPDEYRDIELAIKASYRGEAAVMNPRAMVRLENGAWA